MKAVVVDNRAYREDEHFRQMLELLSAAGENQVLDLQPAGVEEARRLLEDGQVAGIITAGAQIGLGVKEPGLGQSILKAVLDEYAHTTATMKSIIGENPAVAGQLVEELARRPAYTRQISFSRALPETMLAYFYALIAMACLYSAFWGLKNTTDLQADLSAQGARRSAAPTHKLKVVLSDSLAALIISFLEVLFLLAYLMLVLKISFGQELGYVLLTCLAGCLAGVSFGNLIGTALRGSEGAKVGALIGGSMAMCFLAGLMWVDMKYLINSKAPLLSYLNPAALISDAFYSLYLFENHRRFIINIGMLLLLSAVMSIISFIRLRRERYASI